MAQPPTPPRSPLTHPLVRGGVAAVLLAILFGAFAFVRASRDDADGAAPPTTVGAPTRGATEAPEQGLGALDSRPPIVGDPAPDFVLRDIDGMTIKLSDLRGQVVWINFWATWCAPCKKELPVIQKLYDEKRSAGLVVLALNWDESAGDARAYFENAGLSMPLLLDRGGHVYDQYRLQGLPHSFFIDRSGNLATLHHGFLPEDKMRERLEQAGMP